MYNHKRPAAPISTPRSVHLCAVHVPVDPSHDDPEFEHEGGPINTHMPVVMSSGSCVDGALVHSQFETRHVSRAAPITHGAVAGWRQGAAAIILPDFGMASPACVGQPVHGMASNGHGGDDRGAGARGVRSPYSVGGPGRRGNEHLEDVEGQALPAGDVGSELDGGEREARQWANLDWRSRKIAKQQGRPRKRSTSGSHQWA